MTTAPTITTTTFVITTEHCLGEGDWLDTTELARACRAEAGFIDTRFGSDALARVRRIHRLQTDFDASLQAVGLMRDLIDENDRLRSQWQRMGPHG